MTGHRCILKMLLIVSLLTVSAFADQDIGKTIIVKVNGVPLSRADLDIQIDRLLPQSAYHGTITPAKRNKIEKKAMKNLIEEELYYQEAQKQRLKSDEKAVKEKLDDVRKKFSSEEAMNQTLKKNNMTLDMFREKVRRLLLVENLIEKEVKVSLSEEELSAYYDANSEKFIMPESVRLRYIWIMFDPSDPEFRKTAKKRADEALAQLKAGVDIAEVAWNYADNMSRVKGGDIGYIHRGRLPKEVEDVAFSLKIGELSNIIENETGFHILRVEDRKESRQIPFEEIKERLKRSLTDSREKKRRTALLDRLQASAQIEYLTDNR